MNQLPSHILEIIQQEAEADYQKSDYYKPLGETMWIKASVIAATHWAERCQKMAEKLELIGDYLTNKIHAYNSMLPGVESNYKKAVKEEDLLAEKEYMVLKTVWGTSIKQFEEILTKTTEAISFWSIDKVSGLPANSKNVVANE